MRQTAAALALEGRTRGGIRGKEAVRFGVQPLEDKKRRGRSVLQDPGCRCTLVSVKVKVHAS